VKTTFHRVSTFIDRHGLIKGARGVLVAVSGGPDSVALLDMLFRLTAGTRETDQRNEASNTLDETFNRLEPSIAGPPLYIAHLDHMLRGEESTQDATFVRVLAEGLGLAATVTSIEVREIASSKGQGIEETAREVRYDFLLRTALETGCDRIAVGHTMNDQAETFLMRLIRGTGLRGLSAMRPVSPVPGIERPTRRQSQGEVPPQDPQLSSMNASHENSVPLLIRPLLCISRDEVLEYCRQRDLEYRTDATNSSSDYTRTQIRNQILPALAEINPQIVESIFRATENIAGDEALLNGMAASILARARLPEPNSLGEPGLGSYSVAAILEHPAGMQRRIISEAILLARLNAINVSGVHAEITAAHIAAVESLLNPGTSGKRVILPGALEVWREYNTLVLRRVSPELERPYEVELSVGHPRAEAGGFALNLQRGLSVTALDSIIETNRQEKDRGSLDWMSVALDDQRLPERLKIRTRLRGERTRVIGCRRTIKLKNLMIDHRIPSSRRATWPIVTTPDGSYIWSPGLPPSLEFAARAESQGLAILRASAI